MVVVAVGVACVRTGTTSGSAMHPQFFLLGDGRNTSVNRGSEWFRSSVG